MFCSAAECHEAAFPWTATHIACSTVTGSAIAVVTKPSPGEEPWLHILDGNVQDYADPCAPAQPGPLSAEAVPPRRALLFGAPSPLPGRPDAVDTLKLSCQLTLPPSSLPAHRV